MTKSRVFTAAKPKYSIEGCSSFGEFEHAFSRNETRSALWTKPYAAELLDRFEQLGFNPDSDYVVDTGTKAEWSIIVATLASYYGRLCILLFNSLTRRYEPVEIGNVRGCSKPSSHCGTSSPASLLPAAGIESVNKS